MGGGGSGVQGGCERRIEVFAKIQKKNGGVRGGWVGGGWVGGGGGWGGGQGGCERRIEVFWENSHKKNSGGGGGGGGLGEGGPVGGRVGGGVRVDVNAMLGVGGDVGYGGCEPRIEGIVQCTKRYCTILEK